MTVSLYVRVSVKGKRCSTPSTRKGATPGGPAGRLATDTSALNSRCGAGGGQCISVSRNTKRVFGELLPWRYVAVSLRGNVYAPDVLFGLQTLQANLRLCRFFTRGRHPNDAKLCPFVVTLHLDCYPWRERALETPQPGASASDIQRVDEVTRGSTTILNPQSDRHNHLQPLLATFPYARSRQTLGSPGKRSFQSALTAGLSLQA